MPVPDFKELKGKQGSIHDNLDESYDVELVIARISNEVDLDDDAFINDHIKANNILFCVTK